MIAEGALGIHATAYRDLQDVLTRGAFGADVHGATGEVAIEFRGEGLGHGNALHDVGWEDVQRSHLHIRVGRRQGHAIEVGRVVAVREATHHHITTTHRAQAHEFLHPFGHIAGAFLLQFLCADLLHQGRGLLPFHHQHPFALTVGDLHHFELLHLDALGLHLHIGDGALVGHHSDGALRGLVSHEAHL